MTVNEPIHFQMDTEPKQSQRIREILNCVNSVRAGIVLNGQGMLPNHIAEQQIFHL